MNQLFADPSKIQFPPTTEGVHYPSVEFPVPPDVIFDPHGRLFCIVCHTILSHSENNVLQHIHGKRHAKNNLRVTGGNIHFKNAIRRCYVKAVEKQYSNLHSPGPNGCRANAHIVSPYPSVHIPPDFIVPNMSPQKNEGESVPPTLNTTDPTSLGEILNGSAFDKSVQPSTKSSDSPTQQEASLNTGNAKKTQKIGPPLNEKEKKEKIKEERLKFAKKVLEEAKLDSNEFIQQLLSDNSGSDGSEDDRCSDGSASEAMRQNYSARRRSELSFEYKAPPGPDLTFDAMAPETQREDHTARMHEAFSSLTRDHVVVSLDKENETDSKSASSSQFISFKVKKGEETGIRGFGLRRKQWISQNNWIVLHDENGEELPPWLLSRTETENVLFSADSSIALHFEILQFAEFVSPTNDEIQARNEVFIMVESITKKLWPDSSVQVFGSVATDLALPSSDVDIAVMGTPKGGSIDELEQLANAVRNISGFAKRVQVINAKVPLVKIISRSTGMNCDICVGVDNGVSNVPRIKEFLRQYPALRPLLLVIKCFLRQRGLNDVYTGGFGSYALLLMIVSYLQMLPYNFPRSKLNLGAQLQQFFELYGKLWNPCLAGLQIRDGGMYYDKFERYGTSPGETSRFSIEDPNDLSNEIARNSFNVVRLRRAFLTASGSLIRWRRDDGSNDPTPLGTLIFTEREFLNRRKVVIEDLSRKQIEIFRENVKEKHWNQSDRTRTYGSARQTDVAAQVKIADGNVRPNGVGVHDINGVPLLPGTENSCLLDHKPRGSKRRSDMHPVLAADVHNNPEPGGPTSRMEAPNRLSNVFVSNARVPSNFSRMEQVNPVSESLFPVPLTLGVDMVQGASSNVMHGPSSTCIYDGNTMFAPSGVAFSSGFPSSGVAPFTADAPPAEKRSNRRGPSRDVHKTARRGGDIIRKSHRRGGKRLGVRKPRRQNFR